MHGEAESCTNPSLNISMFACVYVQIYFFERICKTALRLLLLWFIFGCHTNTFKCGEWPEHDLSIQIHDDEGMLAAASLTVLGSVNLFKVYTEGKEGKSLS